MKDALTEIGWLQTHQMHLFSQSQLQQIRSGNTMRKIMASYRAKVSIFR